ncbi:MAG TPA: LysR family transcriptional regulator [Paracoccaceae bacterium]|nr:LysR family transcriptional regulator [Paracoccaceae bacterium]
MDRFREIEAFAAIAEAGSFSRAARRLGASAPAVTRLIAALEARLGARLIHRTTRRLTLTAAGTAFHAEAGGLLAQLARAEAAASGAQTLPRGELRLTAPVLFGERYLMPLVREHLAAWPEVTVSALLVDRIVNLVEEGIDLALRIAPLPDSGLTAIRLGAVRRVVVAAPAYLARAGIPARPAELAGHAIITAGTLDPLHEWSFRRGGRLRSVRFVPRLAVTSVAAAIEAAAAGLGIARVLSYQVAERLAAGSLVELLPEAEDRETPVSLVHFSGRAAPLRLRSFLDLAVPRLRAEAHRFLAAPAG